MLASETIESVVRAFYGKARTDVLIGYHFARIPDFEAHLPRIFAFWELQLLGSTTRTLESPLDAIRAHVPLRIHTGEVNRWVKLFHETLDESALDSDSRDEWRAKLTHFQQVFLRSPLLFSSQG
jgi:truncated hemoglobin YjbI